MNSDKQISIAWYVVMDYVMAALAWLLFYIIRSAMANDTGLLSHQLSCLVIYFGGRPGGLADIVCISGNLYIRCIKNQDWRSLRLHLSAAFLAVSFFFSYLFGMILIPFLPIIL